MRIAFLSLLLPFFLVAEPIADIHIPVVDMNDFSHPEKQEAFLDTLFDAMSQLGFFAVRNTGVDAAVIKNAYAQSEAFFKQDRAAKMECHAALTGGQRGFVPGETAKGYKAKDQKEFFHIGREMTPVEHQHYNIAQNIWPVQSGYRDAMLSLYTELNHYVIPLQRAIIAALNKRTGAALPLDHLNNATEHGDILLRALYYPALSEEQIQNLSEPLYWAAAHTDIDYLAILPFATEKGLQVQIDGEWFYVVVPEDTFIVNVGDMLENHTNGLLKSARHRVQAYEPNKDRFSMVLFVHPTDDTSLAPLPCCIAAADGIQRYAPGTRKEFLWERLLELNIAPLLLDPYSKTGHTERQLQYGRESKQVVEMLLEHNLASPALLDALNARKE